MPKSHIVCPENPSVESASADVDGIAATRRMLAEIALAEVKVDSFPMAGGDLCDIIVSLPYGCYLDGYFTWLENGEVLIKMGNWNVDQRLRRNGIGRRLMEKFREQALQLGATHVQTCAVSREGMNGVSSLFGFENLEIIGLNAPKYKGMQLGQLLDLMEENPEMGYPLRIKIK